jgi:hypothetical protein
MAAEEHVETIVAPCTESALHDPDTTCGAQALASLAEPESGRMLAGPSRVGPSCAAPSDAATSSTVAPSDCAPVPSEAPPSWVEPSEPGEELLDPQAAMAHARNGGKHIRRHRPKVIVVGTGAMVVS